MAEPFETTFILFVDMLGFAALVEAEGDELDELSPIFTNVELYSPSSAESLLGYRFINFHRCLNQARVRLQELGAGTGIVFSDSAFFRLDSLVQAIDFARTLMFELVTCEIPVRMGLARGSYRMLRFLTDSSAHVSFHMSQFLGTGIVHAYQAERCGVAGLRILLHPNLDSLLDRTDSRVIQVVSKHATSPVVTFAVNYLDSNESSSGPDYDDCIQFDGLRNMIALADEAFHYHYLETFSAWNRMRAQLGRSEYPWAKCVDRDAYEDEHGTVPRGFEGPRPRRQ
jgi:hypothetical protein